MRPYEFDYKTIIDLDKVVYVNGPLDGRYTVYLEGGYSLTSHEFYEKFMKAWLNKEEQIIRKDKMLSIMLGNKE